MSKHGRQADSVRFCSALFSFIIGDRPKNCQMVIPMANARKHKSDITQVSNAVTKYLEESQAKYAGN